MSSDKVLCLPNSALTIPVIIYWNSFVPLYGANNSPVSILESFSSRECFHISISDFLCNENYFSAYLLKSAS